MEIRKLRNCFIISITFQEFFQRQTKNTKRKIGWTLDLIQFLDRIPETYLKHIENSVGLYEIRVQAGSNIFRIFCFFDEGNLIIILHGFHKKTQKTPGNEIKKAEWIKNDYYEEKKRQSYLP